MVRCVLLLFALFNLGRLSAAEISPLADKPRWPTLERYQEAEQRFGEAVRLCRATGNQRGLAAALGNRALALWAARRSVTQAVSFLEEAVELHDALGETAEAASCRVNLVRLLVEHDSA